MNNRVAPGGEGSAYSSQSFATDQYGRRIYTKSQRDAIYAEFFKQHPQKDPKQPLDISGLPTRDEMDK
jgi:hypothetical protein